jgi:hypothetical protein
MRRVKTVYRRRNWLWLVVLALSGGIAALAGWQAARAASAKSWRSAEGRIISSQLVAGCGRNGAQTFPRIQYEYRYEGAVYAGSRVAVDTDYCGWSKAGSEIVERYRPGSNVKVFVNPARPSESSLIVGDPQSLTIWALAISFMAIALSIAMLLQRGRARAT